MNKTLLICNEINKLNIGEEFSCPDILCPECIFKGIENCNKVTIEHKELARKYIRENAKELNIHDVIEIIKEGEEFESSFNIVAKVNGRVKITSKNSILDSVYIALDEVFCRCVEVITFNEAYEAMKAGKMAKILNSNLIYKEGFFKGMNGWQPNNGFSIDEIEGNWVVVEEVI